MSRTLQLTLCTTNRRRTPVASQNTKQGRGVCLQLWTLFYLLKDPTVGLGGKSHDVQVSLVISKQADRSYGIVLGE